MSKNEIMAVASLTLQGDRPVQEDHVLLNKEKKIFAVADGFGGPIAGAVVAKQACEAVRGFLEREAGDLEATLPFVLRQYFSLAGNVLFNALIHSNRKVNTYNKDKNVHEKGGASLLAGFVDGDLLSLANVGVCGACLFRSGKVTDLVIPRSYKKLCDPGNQGQIQNGSRLMDVPLMALGVHGDLEPEIVEYKIQARDVVLLHTDGLLDEEKERLATIIDKNLAAGPAVEEAMQTIKNVNRSDNLAAILIHW